MAVDISKFSVITLSYNQRSYLERAVNSVLTQDWPDLEYIVVDPGSTDGSREFLSERLANVPSRLIFASDRGPAHGLNKGLSVATGDIIAYLNADDVYLPGAFHGAATAFRDHPDASVVYGDGFIARAGRLRSVRSTKFTPWRYAYGMSTVLQQATFLRRDLAARVQFNEANRTCWDGELLVDIALSGGHTVHVQANWGLFEVHPGSITGSGRLRSTYRADRRRIAAKILGRRWRISDELYLQAIRAALQTRNLVRHLRDQSTRTAPITMEDL